MNLRGQAVYVGLSGGVDSAVSAALLKRAGARVTGVFIKGWYPPGMPCTWAEDRRDAMRVAAHLRIPFRTLDASEEYRRGVIDYLLREYADGRTPNPDVMCNRDVKFGAFARYAKERGAAYLATGHYARITHDGGETHVLRGSDPAKDQSYFLWAVSKAALDMTLFPVGGMEKIHVRSQARRFGLPVASKRDSQGICFLGAVSVEEYLRTEFSPIAGKALDEDGGEAGTHDGAVLYTLGERVALRDAAAGPWYVVGKRMRDNELIVSHSARPQGIFEAPRALSLFEVNLLAPCTGPVTAQYRYHGQRVSGTFTKKGARGGIFVPEMPLSDYVATGQSLALYAGDELLGGGIIDGIHGTVS
ncbi:MAG: tRNA 2-thiouridine(34) synthase MnmA [Patescibacteria group bacterium]|nr:tRNA 2-thiouridine(34) synthase MnmA [Patescibacteria group bacterium]MDE1965849.1 tRNA 2-thiouridine(34) synthase MnmA [Patescibacteria group bacterium]